MSGEGVAGAVFTPDPPEEANLRHAFRLSHPTPGSFRFGSPPAPARCVVLCGNMTDSHHDDVDISGWPGYDALENAPALNLGAAGQPVRTLARGLLRWAWRIALPLASVSVVLHEFPYRGTAAGVHFQVSGTVFAHPGLSADTTFGNWEFPHVSGLPVGLHVSPVDVDLLRLVANGGGGPAFADRLRSDVADQIPEILTWIGVEVILGLLLGLALAAALNMSGQYLSGRTRGSMELGRRARQLAAALVVLLLVAGYGALTYNPSWTRQSRLTGTLGAAQLVPDQLARYYSQQSKFFDVLGAITGIQARLQQQIAAKNAPADAFNIMYISDMHLAATYPLVKQYVDNFHVKLVINTGDETEFGRSVELTDTYRAQLQALTQTVPMIWLAGNHDSPEIVTAMSAIPGVIVVGTKTYQSDGTYQVTAQQLRAFGLSIAALPDPRVYGGSGAFGADKDSVTDPLETHAADAAVHGVTSNFDIFATHEPVAAIQLVKDLPNHIRQTVAGHTHAQNAPGDIQSGRQLTLVEGSTGAGGLDHINSGGPATPIEFSVESVAADCQFTKIVRFQIDSSSVTGGDLATSYAQQVTASTSYLTPQKLDTGRTCGTSQPITPVTAVTPTR